MLDTSIVNLLYKICKVLTKEIDRLYFASLYIQTINILITIIKITQYLRDEFDRHKRLIVSCSNILNNLSILSLSLGFKKLYLTVSIIEQLTNKFFYNN